MGVDILAQSGRCYKLVMNDLTDIKFEAGTFSFWPGFGIGKRGTPTPADAAQAKDEIDDRAYLEGGPLLEALLGVLPQVALKRPENPLLWIGRNLVTKTGRCRKIVLLTGRQFPCSSWRHQKFAHRYLKKRARAIPYGMSCLFSRPPSSAPLIQSV